MLVKIVIPILLIAFFISVLVSAKTGAGLEEMEQAIRNAIFGHYKEVHVTVPYGEDQFISYIHEHAYVKSTRYEEDGTKLTVEASPAMIQKWSHLLDTPTS